MVGNYRAESRGGDDRLVALAELPLCYQEPGAGVGSNEIRTISSIGSTFDQVPPYRRDDVSFTSLTHFKSHPMEWWSFSLSPQGANAEGVVALG